MNKIFARKERPEDGFPHEISPNRPYFVFDLLGDGFLYYATEEERDKESESIIQDYLGDGWDEEVVNVIAGKLTHRSTQCDVVQRPDDSLLDEEGVDEDGYDWREFSYKCNYKLAPIGDTK